MEITISKQDFEKFVPVAASAHDSIFNSVKQHFQWTVDETEELYLGSKGVTAANASDDIMYVLKKYVSIQTFLMMMEQKDVVLTPTGFGVVSNDQLAPASTGRVNAVHVALQRDSLIALSRLIKLLTTVSGWGDQEVASEAIAVPLWSIRQMMKVYGNKITAETFYHNIAIERAAMQKIRGWIGDGTVDYCLSGIRNNRSDDYKKITKLMESIVICNIDGDMVQEEQLYRKLLLTLERNLTVYTIYAQSDEYNANIAERYENKQEDSAFFFG